MKKIFQGYFIVIILILFTSNVNVWADGINCRGMYDKNQAYIGDEITYNIGTYGVASNIYISGLNYVIENYDENNIVTVTGNKDFNVGENTVLIKVANKNVDVYQEYCLTIMKAEKEKAPISLIVSVGFLVVAISTLMIMVVKNKKVKY